MKKHFWVIFYALLLVLLPAAAISQQAAPTRESVENEMRAVETETVAILQKEFGEDLEVKYLLQNYHETEPGDKPIMMMAMFVYVDVTLKPKLKNPSPEQRQSLDKLKALGERFTAAQAALEKLNHQ